MPLPDPFAGRPRSAARHAEAARGSASSARRGGGVGSLGGLSAGGGGRIGGPKPAPADAPPVRLIYPPWVYKLPQSQDFNTNDYRVALAGNAIVAGPGFQLPSSQIGWLQQFRLYVLASAPTTDVSFIVRINEAPVAGWTRTNPPGTANIVLLTENEMQVAIPDGARVDVLFVNNSANAEVVGAQLAGWYHPMSAEAKYWGERGQ